MPTYRLLCRGLCSGSLSRLRCCGSRSSCWLIQMSGNALFEKTRNQHFKAAKNTDSLTVIKYSTALSGLLKLARKALIT